MLAPVRVLVVDDDSALCELLVASLTFAGFEVSAVRSATAALKAQRSTPSDVLVVDGMLPDLDGVDLVRLVREVDERVAVVMVTARDEVSDRVAGLAAGADDYVSKPFDVVELAARIRAVLRRGGGPHAGGGAALRLGDLVVDPAAVRAERAGHRLDLSPTEFRLLAALVGQQGRVLSKSELLREVWGYEFGDAAVVEKFVSQLRRKLGDPPLVHTVRGFGYVARDDRRG